MTWVLVIALYLPLDRLEAIVPVPASFDSYDACWLAGYRISLLDDLNFEPDKPPAKHIAWECVPTSMKE